MGTGRAEHDLSVDASTERLLEGLPDYVRGFYTWQRTSSNATTCYEYIKNVRKFLYWIDQDISRIDFSAVLDAPARYLQGKTYCSVGGELRATRISSRKNIYYALQSFYKYLTCMEIITKNPFEMGLIKVPRGKDKIHRPNITAEDLNRMLVSARTGGGRNRGQAWKQRDTLILLFLIYTGMRREALCEIDIDDVNIERGEVTILDKGTNGKEHTYLIAPIIPEVKKWLSERAELMDGNLGEENALFISERRRRISASAVRKIVNLYSEEALGVRYSPHKIRSAFCTILYKETGDIRLVQSVVGHESINTTYRYIPESKSAKEKAVSILQGCIN